MLPMEVGPDPSSTRPVGPHLLHAAQWDPRPLPWSTRPMGSHLLHVTQWGPTLTYSQKHDAVHILIESNSSKTRYKNLGEAIARVQNGVNEALGIGARFVLEETKGFYVGRAQGGGGAAPPIEATTESGSEGSDSDGGDPVGGEDEGH